MLSIGRILILFQLHMWGVGYVNTHSVCGVEKKTSDVLDLDFPERVNHPIRVTAIERGPYSNQFTFLTAEPSLHVPLALFISWPV